MSDRRAAERINVNITRAASLYRDFEALDIELGHALYACVVAARRAREAYREYRERVGNPRHAETRRANKEAAS